MLICENLYCSGFPLSFMRNRMIIIMAILFQHHQELSIMTFSLCCRFFVPPSSFCGCLFVGAKACSGLLLFALAWWERGDCRTKGALGIHSSNSSCSNRIVFLGGGRNRLPLPPRGCSFFASSMAFSMSPCISCSLYIRQARHFRYRNRQCSFCCEGGERGCCCSPATAKTVWPERILFFCLRV